MIPDENFIKNPNIPGPTKEEVRCLVMCKSQVKTEDIVVDIGSGTGGLTVEFAKRAKMVYSVDKNPDAINITKSNLEIHEVSNKVHIIQGTAPEALLNIPKFDILMIGGSSGELSSIIKEGYKKLNNGGRIVVTSILIETRVVAVKTLLSLGLNPDVVDVSISKGRIMERGTLMMANNPVTIITAFKLKIK
ncbi:MAG: precorrin-6Y C5,15-methyltransferase (decarboxylating) subunit CbiT [Methanobacterium sp.]